MKDHTALEICANTKTTASEVAKQLPHVSFDRDVQVTIEDGYIYADELPGEAWEPDGDRYRLPLIPSFAAICSARGASRVSGRDAFVTDDYQIVEAIASDLGSPFTVVDVLRHGRRYTIFEGRGHRVFVKTTRHKDDPPTDWASPSPQIWERQIGYAPKKPMEPPKDYDDRIRRLENASGTSGGWVVRKQNGEWTTVSVSELKMHLQHLGHPKSEAETIIGRYANDPWKLVSLPFQDEHPGGRQWNRFRTTWRSEPLPWNNWRELESWLKILSHIGRDLDDHVQPYGFIDGAHFLFCWLASLVQKPFEPLPYLFLYGEEGTGKSIFHEAFELLVTGGVVKADRALTSQSDFNGELLGCILGVVEEKDIARVKGAYAKIKDAVTARKLSIRKMRTDSFMVDNTTHWVQCSNDPSSCPMFEGGTRIQPIRVDQLKHDIPKPELLAALAEEGPRFAYCLANAKLPEPTGRMMLPIIDTPTRQKLIDDGRPEWLLAIPSLMADRNTWTGTAREFSVALAENQLSFDAPATMRKLKTGLCAGSGYLTRNCIDFDVSDSGKHAQTLTITKAI
ncbi:primase-helicase family protein [Blastopirellula marina]|uniref:NrS-1 polymerase-like helicase domain-containing protein n=1 Tax=Blastopirellula marina TaxID=124 RepID=A0A2S8GSK9_9BACT|nr:primase-helicase family protein [Blastopirellula marina]PQO47014.1 hypothetical protein C5Y93_05835 [Blastopirellula marina]